MTCCITLIATYKGRHSQDPNYSLTEAPRIQKKNDQEIYW